MSHPRELDIPRLAKSSVVNYLHQGNALDVWYQHLPCGEEPVAKAHLLARLRSSPAAHSGLATLIRGYLPRQKEFRPNDFQAALRESIEWRKQFHALGCRGFSYALDLEMKEYNRQQATSWQLGSQINLRIALVPRKDLFYPPRLKRYFRQMSWGFNHYSVDGLPSIAFCFGRKTNQAWYVFVMQSDLASKGPSFIREHFRGWRKVLFANVVAQAQGKTGAVYLCGADDVDRAWYQGWKQNSSSRETEIISLGLSSGVPPRWRTIYDGTAGEWGMPLVKLSEPVDVQIYRTKKPVHSEYLYELLLCGQQAVALAEAKEALST